MISLGEVAAVAPVVGWVDPMCVSSVKLFFNLGRYVTVSRVQLPVFLCVSLPLLFFLQFFSEESPVLDNIRS